MKVGGRILAWCCIVASYAILAPAERASASTIGYIVEGGLDLDCTENAVPVAGGCAFRAMFDLIDPVMDGSTGNPPVNIMFELLDASNNVLSSYVGPFLAATVVVQASGVVTESDITDGAITGYSLSANFWSWGLNGFSVPVDFVDLNGVSVSSKPSFEGCGPGYFKQPQHLDEWVDYSPTDNYEVVVGVATSFPEKTLLEVLQQGGGGDRAMGRHAVAALLNASSSVVYAFSDSTVIALVQDAYATGDFESARDMLEGANDAGFCPLM